MLVPLTCHFDVDGAPEKDKLVVYVPKQKPYWGHATKKWMQWSLEVNVCSHVQFEHVFLMSRQGQATMFATSIGGSTIGLDIKFSVQYGATRLGTDQWNGKT